jgi:hypothetical protein
VLKQDCQGFVLPQIIKISVPTNTYDPIKSVSLATMEHEVEKTEIDTRLKMLRAASD